MPEIRSQRDYTALFGVFFTIIALIALVVLVMSKSKADSGTTTGQVGVSNTAPTVDSIIVSTSQGGNQITTASLAEAATVTHWVIATISDANGCQNIDQDIGYLGMGRTGAVSTNSADATPCTANNSNCYYNLNTAVTWAGCTGTTDTDQTAETSFAIK